MKKWQNILSIMVVLLAVALPLISAGGYMDYLTKALADTLYCRIGGHCEVSSLTVNNLTVIGDYFNVSVINYNVTGNIDITGNVTADYFIGNGTYINSINCSNIVGGTDTDFCTDASGNGTSSSSGNFSDYVPYVNATKDVNLGNHNITLNRSIYFTEDFSDGFVKTLWYVNPSMADGFRAEYWYEFEGTNDDWIVFRKTDGNDDAPDGGIAFMMTNNQNANRTVLKLDGYGLANFTNYSIATTENVTAKYFCNLTGSCFKLTDLNVSGSGSTDLSGLVNVSMFDNETLWRKTDNASLERVANRSGFILNWSGIITSSGDGNSSWNESMARLIFYDLTNQYKFLNVTSIVNSTIARIGNCSTGSYVINVTTEGVICGTSTSSSSMNSVENNRILLSNGSSIASDGNLSFSNSSKVMLANNIHLPLWGSVICNGSSYESIDWSGFRIIEDLVPSCLDLGWLYSNDKKQYYLNFTSGANIGRLYLITGADNGSVDDLHFHPKSVKVNMSDKFNIILRNSSGINSGVAEVVDLTVYGESRFDGPIAADQLSSNKELLVAKGPSEFYLQNALGGNILELNSNGNGTYSEGPNGIYLNMGFPAGNAAGDFNNTLQNFIAFETVSAFGYYGGSSISNFMGFKWSPSIKTAKNVENGTFQVKKMYMIYPYFGISTTFNTSIEQVAVVATDSSYSTMRTTKSSQGSYSNAKWGILFNSTRHKNLMGGVDVPTYFGNLWSNYSSITERGFNMAFNTTGEFYFYNSTGLGHIHAGEYLTSTGVFDNTKGTALSMIKDSSVYINQSTKGALKDHSAYGDCARNDIETDYSRPVIRKYLVNLSDPNSEDIEITYPYTKTLYNNSVSIDCLRARYEQAIYELKVQNQNLTTTLQKICATLPKGTC